MPLPEYFRLPDSHDHDDLIEGLQKDIDDEGGPRLYLGMIRYQRRMSERFHMRVLNPLSNHALLLEEKNEMGLTVDRDHRLANAALSGMLFGHVLSEGVYPGLSRIHRTYSAIGVNTHFMDDKTSETFEMNGTTSTVEGLRIGYTAMAQTVLNGMSGTTIDILKGWSDETLLHPAHQSSFIHGVGLVLYANWDYYADLLSDEGRSLVEPVESS
jgi:hypothetical protein